MPNDTKIGGSNLPAGKRASVSRMYLALGACLSVILPICLMQNGCRRVQPVSPVVGAAIEFTSVPSYDRRDVLGDPSKLGVIKGRVINARPGQQIVLYAHALNDEGQMIWYVQPLALEPFTEIHADSTWRSSTHPGSEYAALLVDPGFQPPLKSHALPTEGVIASATTPPWPPIWQSWWFAGVCLAAAAAIMLGLRGVWTYEVTRKLNARFEERLAERTRVAQELHDTLLQGVLSASMQLHVAVDQLPEDSPVRPRLNRVLQLISQVVDEGRTTLRGLRSSFDSGDDLKSSFLRIPQEVGTSETIDYRVVVEGEPSSLRSIIRDDVYSIGREALVNAFRHSQARKIEVQLEYAPKHLRILVRDDGLGIDPHVLESGRDGHWGLSGMRERAERIGARLKVLSRAGYGTEVELNVPGHIIFESQSLGWASKWRMRLSGSPAQARGTSKHQV